MANGTVYSGQCITVEPDSSAAGPGNCDEGLAELMGYILHKVFDARLSRTSASKRVLATV
jgi:hypothetical protein